MRTIIEIRNKQWAQLLALAAERGERGFSALAREALDQYLSSSSGEDTKLQGAIDALGTLDDEAADELWDSVRAVRSRWR